MVGGLLVAALISGVFWATIVMIAFHLAGAPLSTTVVLIIAGCLSAVTGLFAAPLFLARSPSED